MDLSGTHTCSTCGRTHAKANGGRPITVCPFCGTRTPFQVPKRGPIVRIAEEDLQDLLALDVPVFGDPDWDELEEEHRLYKEDHDCA